MQRSLRIVVWHSADNTWPTQRWVFVIVARHVDAKAWILLAGGFFSRPRGDIEES